MDEILTAKLHEGIRELLEKKAKTEEKDLNPQMPVIIDFIRSECVRQKQISDAAPDDHRHDYTELNGAFRKLLNGGLKTAIAYYSNHHGNKKKLPDKAEAESGKPVPQL